MRKAAVTLLAIVLSCLQLGAVDWKAQWIGAPWDGEDYNRDVIMPAPQFRKTFDAQKKIKSATAYVTGLGFFEFYVNGKKMGDDVLSPNETSYSHRADLNQYAIAMDDTNWRNFRVFYLTYDITKQLNKGTNELGAFVGNGFFSTGRTRWVSPYGTPRFICQVEIEYADGTKDTIVTDNTWEAAKSPIQLNDLFDGEIYDARIEDNLNWEPAAIRKAPDGTLMPQDGPADRIMEVLKPKSIKKLDDGRWEVEFGDYVSGWVRLKNFDAPEGAEIQIDFPIETAGNGVYKYIGKGGKVKEYAPRFCWWVFSKAIISGWQGELKASNIQAEVVHSDVKEYAHFACSNELINKINAIWKRTQTDNMHLGVPTDCPHREKGPYTGDGQASCVTVMHNFDVSVFYRKWLHDITDCQDVKTGYVTNGAPWHPGCGGGVGFGAAMNIIPWEYYLHYGDKEVLAENFFAMKEQVRHMLSWRKEDGTMLQEISCDGISPMYWMNLGEWSPPFSLPSENFSHTWFLWRCASYTAKAAKALGKEDDYAYYQALADEVAAIFHKKFYNPEAGNYTPGTGILSSDGYGTGDGKGTGDGSNIFALAMGVPDDCKDKVIDAVKAELKANNGHLNTGIFATGLFFEVLCDNGMAEEAYTAMTKTDFPSYGAWVAQGAQTTWEQWNGGASHVHPMFGGGLVWLYRRICGVQTDEAEPGYKHVIIKPTPVGDLTWAEYATETNYGDLSVRWDRKNGDSFKLKVKVPSGSHATVYMPDGSAPVELGPGKAKLRCTLTK